MAEYRDAAVLPESKRMALHSEVDNGLKDVLCGSIAGAVGKLVEYPFDTVKVRLQSQPDVGPLHFKGPLDCFQKSIRENGISGLYRGISSPIIGAAAENASLFLVYNWTQRDIIPYLKLESFYGSLVAGAISGAATSFVLTPIELVKCKIQVESMPYISGAVDSGTRPSIWKIISSVYKEKNGGITAFWRGQTGTLLRECGGSASWFGAYEGVSSYFKNVTCSDTLSLPQSLLAGASAGVSYNLSLFPADTIKSRIQTVPELSNQGFWSVGLSIYRNGGIPALYRGCGITLARAVPSSALIFMTYEQLKTLL